LSRRRLTVEFNRPLYDKSSEAKEMIKLDQGIVKGLWKHYLPGLVNWVLQMSDEEMRQYLLDTYEMVPALRRVRNEILLNSNNLVEWLQSEIVIDEKAVTCCRQKNSRSQRCRRALLQLQISPLRQLRVPLRRHWV
jgi:putative DNA primase/helicase